MAAALKNNHLNISSIEMILVINHPVVGKWLQLSNIMGLNTVLLTQASLVLISFSFYHQKFGICTFYCGGLYYSITALWK